MSSDGRPKLQPYSVGLEECVLAKKRLEGDAFAKELGERAARLRKERGITQKEMAERLGVTQPHVSFYESGAMRLHGELIAKLAQVLDVSADVVLGLAAHRQRPAAQSHAPKLPRTLLRVSSLPERDQRAVFRLISSLAASHAGR
jgi:transcriptional regulator with XRE-family HTH domain